MPKISIYKNESYCFTYGADDPVFIDLAVKVTKLSESEFTMELVKYQLGQQMEFARFLLPFITAEGVMRVESYLRERLTEELTPSLFTLFYAGELQPDENAILRNTDNLLGPDTR